MPETWMHMNCGLGAPATNMAVDEALLEWSATHGMPVLRFYGWSRPAATFGYFQRYRDVEDWTQLRPLIRRPTGGGLVPHDADWTYSLIFPPSHPWFGMKAVESYRRVHDWIFRAFERLGVATALAPVAVKEVPGQCFAGAEQFDLLRDGVKIAGAAQRRNRFGLLIQGSIQPGAMAVQRRAWEDAMLCAVNWPGGVEWRVLESRSPFDERVTQLSIEKYSQSSYNQRR